MDTAALPRLAPEEAAAMIRNGDTLALGGFTSAGTPKSFVAALAGRAASEQNAGRDFSIRLLSVATGAAVDGALAGAIRFRSPYQCSPVLRAAINSGDCGFVDMHLSHLTQALRYGTLGPLDWAIVEAAEITPAGELLLTSAVGGAPTFCHLARRIFIERNRRHPAALRGLHDLYEPADPPHRREIPIYTVSDRIGAPLLPIDAAKVAGIIESDLPDEGTAFAETTPLTQRIGANVAAFLAAELAAGRLPRSFLPVQSGVGDVANSVLLALGSHPEIPPFFMYTEVVQDAVIGLMDAGRIPFASATSLSVSPEALRHVYANFDSFRRRMVLRPQEITNHPEVVRRLGLISINTALEADIFGNINSTHLMGAQMMNGIGGSGDFTRNARIAIFICPSTRQEGRISTIVPMVTHVDHTEHSVQILATEWGVADLRGLPPRERARAIIGCCAHPGYREPLHAYLALARGGHTPHSLRAAFSFHERYALAGDMRAAPPQ